MRVYPRACGGTDSTSVGFSIDRGLSPRLRGNRIPGSVCNLSGGSIPAPAGEPFVSQRLFHLSGVYPRACGGTYTTEGDADGYVGLSPRLRGNPGTGYSDSKRLGSIPAPAGEPTSSTSAAFRSWVYPRACGGTQTFYRSFMAETGLSPRLRGNPLRRETMDKRIGSIPAPAGEPRSAAPSPGSRPVYPRACGGT